MKLLNRSAVIVRYREPFLTWAGAVFEDGADDVAEMRDAISVYVVPPDPSEEAESAPLENFFAAIFEHELESWCTDRARWPERRDLVTFRDWFETTAESVVVDLALGGIRSEPC